MSTILARDTQMRDHLPLQGKTAWSIRQLKCIKHDVLVELVTYLIMVTTLRDKRCSRPSQPTINHRSLDV